MGSSTAIEDQYINCAKAALTFEVPCCDDPEYTHLPDVCFVMHPIDHEQCSISVFELIDQEKDTTITLQQLLVGFNAHKIDASKVVAFLMDRIPQEEKEKEIAKVMLDNVLPRFYDDERRATLLLAYLYKYPIVTTACGCYDFLCFNCKRQHLKGEPCDGEDGFSMETCVVRCRSCRVMIVKTDGCDSLRCQCGFYMQWLVELVYRNRHKRSLLPVDPYDADRMAVYARGSSVVCVSFMAESIRWRGKRVEKLLETHAKVLRTILTRSPWRQRRQQRTNASASKGAD